MKIHMVRDGECLLSIAAEYGVDWDVIWNHPANRELRDTRKTPSVLCAGDLLQLPVPEHVVKKLRAKKSNDFVVPRAASTVVRVRLFDDKGPRKQQLVKLDVEGVLLEATTDAEGVLEAEIPAHARTVMATVGADNERFEIRLGHLDPMETLSGVQGRLENLGYYIGNEHGRMGRNTELAIRLFQRMNQLEQTGIIDDSTRRKLGALHDE